MPSVLLINPNREQTPWPVLPLGACMLATALDRAGHEVELLDLTFARDPAARVNAALRRRRPDVVGITVRNIDNCNFERPVFYLDEIRDSVVRTIRRTAPSVPIVIGGSAVNVSPADCYEFLGVDYAIVGDGEQAMPDLVAALAGGGNLDTVPGLLKPGPRNSRLMPILDTGRMVSGEPANGRATIASLQTSPPSQAHRWVDIAQYAARGSPYPIQSKRGCALKCSYCVYNNIEGHAYRLRPATEVVDEIESAVRDYGVRHVDFVDSTFNLPLSHARAMCEELARRALPIELSTMGLNPAGLNAELVASMKRAGFRSVMCTPESGSEKTLETLHKGFKKQAVINAARYLREGGLPTYWFFMLGAPGETIETVKETLELCDQHIPDRDMVLFSTGIRVYSGTPLERVCKDMGWFENDDPLFFPSWFLSPEVDLRELYDLLLRAAAKHPNWMTNAETVVSPAMTLLLQRGLRMLGYKGPFWQHLPKLFGWAHRVGLRQRGLREHARSAARIEDIPHHR